MAGQLFGGRYRVVQYVARGGMAEVYLAHDDLLDRPVAVKVLFPDLARDASFVERFRREAQSAARLNNPHIVSVYDFGEDGEALYIVMEYVAGEPLSDIIRAEGSLAPERAVAIVADVAAGLDAAHREGIVHRDIKPANVLVADGAAKVADFGIARAIDARQDLTMPGTVIGTATYLSPEQALGRPADARSDVYSLGMVLYEMLTGEAPYRGDNLLAVSYKQQNEPPPAPSTFNPAVPPALDAAVARALSYDPAQRQPTALALRTELLAAVPISGPLGPTAAYDPFTSGAVDVAPRTPLPVVPGPSPAGAAMAEPAEAATAMLPAEGAAARRRVPGSGPPNPPLAPGVYRRRRLAALAVAGLVLVGVVVAILTLRPSGTNKVNGTRNTVASTVASSTTTTSTTQPTATTRPPPRTTVTLAPPTTVAVTVPTTVPVTTPPSTTPPTVAPTTTGITTPTTGAG